MYWNTGVQLHKGLYYYYYLMRKLQKRFFFRKPRYDLTKNVRSVVYKVS
jgi:hypothetical protein